MRKSPLLVAVLITMIAATSVVVAGTHEGVEPDVWTKVEAQLEGQGVGPPQKAGWDVPTETAKLLPTPTEDGDGGTFGRSVAIDGDTLVVGANDDDQGGWAGAAYVFGRNVGGTNAWGQVAKLVASDGTSEDFFGISVSISGDTIVVGAEYDDDNGSDSGSAYVFGRNTGGTDAWGQIAKLLASDGTANDLFGYSVDISGDTVIVGASEDHDNGSFSGSAYLFGRDVGGTDGWGQVCKLLPSDNSEIANFGSSVAINGGTVVVGAHPYGTGDLGAAYVFGQDVGGADAWGQVSKLVASDGETGDHFGCSVGISGDSIVVGADSDDDLGSSSGSIYVFDRNQGGTNGWGQVTKVLASDGASGDDFGWSVGISGDTMVIGARSDDDNGPSSGSAYVFERDVGGANAWGQVSKLLASTGDFGDHFGSAVGIYRNTVVVGALSVDGNSSSSGSAYLLGRNQGGADAWGEIKEFVGPSVATAQWNSFGFSVAVDGERVVIGATEDNAVFKSGSAYLFGRNEGGPEEWGLITRLVASDGIMGDSFGSSVSISGNFVVVGAIGDSGLGSYSGSAYVFGRNQGGADAWGQAAKLVASDATSYDYFGGSVGIYGDTVVVGASWGNDGSGSAYVFGRNVGGIDEWGEVAKLVPPDGATNGYFGKSVGIGNEMIVVGFPYDDDNGPESGAAYIFGRDEGGGEDWAKVTKLLPSDGASHDLFGYSVGISDDTVVVGAHWDDDYNNSNSGSAYIFGQDQDGANVWGQVIKLTASDGATFDEFGHSISINGDTVVVGAYRDDDNGPDSGSAYVFGRDQDGTDNWGFVSKITASDGGEYDHFGGSVGVSGDTFVVGAYLDDDFGLGSGSAFIFQGPPNPKVVTVGVAPDPSDGVLSFGEWVPVQITDFSIIFSESMSDPAGDTDPNDVTNPGNWLLVGTGPDGLVQTSSCTAGLSGDDTRMVLDNFVYTDAQLTVDFRADGGSALGQGFYTLFACSSLESAGGEVLDGDGDGAGRDDFALPFGVDLTVPLNPSLSSSSHLTGSWTADDTVDLSWSGADDGGSGVAGYSVVMDTSTATVPDAVIDIAHLTDPHSAVWEPLADGDNWYFHLRTCDIAGNCAAAPHLGPFWIDTTGPAAVSDLVSTSHAVGIPSSEVTIHVEWTSATDALSGVEGYAVEFSNSATWACDGVQDVTGTDATSKNLCDNSWYVHVCAVDAVGNWGVVASAGPFVVEAAVPEVRAVGSEGGAIDGLLTEGESALAAITQLMINFSEPMFNPTGNDTPGDLTNVESYRVLNLGGDGVLSTSDCTSTVGGDDIEVLQTGYPFAWAGDKTVSILGLDDWGLPQGRYTLMVCGLQDLAGHELVGPWIRSFGISANNLLLDPNFEDGALSAWDNVSPDGADIVWADADSSTPASGVVVIDPVGSAVGETFELTQCLDVVEGTPFVLGAISRIDSTEPGAPTLKAMARYYRNPGCTDDLEIAEAIIAQGYTAGAWGPKLYLSSRAPIEALSARVGFIVEASTAYAFVLSIDEAAFFEDAFFVDGFEGGDASWWSATQP